MQQPADYITKPTPKQVDISQKKVSPEDWQKTISTVCYPATSVGTQIVNKILPGLDPAVMAHKHLIAYSLFNSDATMDIMHKAVSQDASQKINACQLVYAAANSYSVHAWGTGTVYSGAR